MLLSYISNLVRRILPQKYLCSCANHTHGAGKWKTSSNNRKNLKKKSIHKVSSKLQENPSKRRDYTRSDNVARRKPRKVFCSSEVDYEVYSAFYKSTKGLEITPPILVPISEVNNSNRTHPELLVKDSSNEFGSKTLAGHEFEPIILPSSSTSLLEGAGIYLDNSFECDSSFENSLQLCRAFSCPALLAEVDEMSIVKASNTQMRGDEDKIPHLTRSASSRSRRRASRPPRSISPRKTKRGTQNSMLALQGADPVLQSFTFSEANWMGKWLPFGKGFDSGSIRRADSMLSSSNSSRNDTLRDFRPNSRRTFNSYFIKQQENPGNLQDELAGKPLFLSQKSSSNAAVVEANARTGQRENDGSEPDILRPGVKETGPIKVPVSDACTYRHLSASSAPPTTMSAFLFRMKAFLNFMENSKFEGEVSSPGKMSQTEVIANSKKKKRMRSGWISDFSRLLTVIIFVLALLLCVKSLITAIQSMYVGEDGNSAVLLDENSTSVEAFSDPSRNDTSSIIYWKILPLVKVYSPPWHGLFMQSGKEAVHFFRVVASSWLLLLKQSLYGAESRYLNDKAASGGSNEDNTNDIQAETAGISNDQITESSLSISEKCISQTLKDEITPLYNWKSVPLDISVDEDTRRSGSRNVALKFSKIIRWIYSFGVPSHLQNVFEAPDYEEVEELRGIPEEVIISPGSSNRHKCFLMSQSGGDYSVEFPDTFEPFWIEMWYFKSEKDIYYSIAPKEFDVYVAKSPPAPERVYGGSSTGFSASEETALRGLEHPSRASRPLSYLSSFSSWWNCVQSFKPLSFLATYTENSVEMENVEWINFGSFQFQDPRVYGHSQTFRLKSPELVNCTGNGDEDGAATLHMNADDRMHGEMSGSLPFPVSSSGECDDVFALSGHEYLLLCAVG